MRPPSLPTHGEIAATELNQASRYIRKAPVSNSRSPLCSGAEAQYFRVDNLTQTVEIRIKTGGVLVNLELTFTELSRGLDSGITGSET